MTDTPADHLEEEPQEERGSPGSRDTGADQPSGGPVDRPAGNSGEESDTKVDPKGTIQEDMPYQPSGDQGG